MKEIRPCGGWDSPIGSADLVRGALALSAPRIDGGRLYWLERRPSEGGRQVVVSGRLSEAATTETIALDGAGELATSGPISGVVDLREESPPGVNVRTRVHEYGGGEYTTGQGQLFYVDDADGRIFGCRSGGGTTPLTPKGACYADLVLSPDGRFLIAIEERPVEGNEPENSLVAIELEGAGGSDTRAAGPPRVVASGHDFYASPVFSPIGNQLAFIAWDHPNMPWNGTVLETVEWGSVGAGRAGSAARWRRF